MPIKSVLFLGDGKHRSKSCQFFYFLRKYMYCTMSSVPCLRCTVQYCTVHCTTMHMTAAQCTEHHLWWLERRTLFLIVEEYRRVYLVPCYYTVHSTAVVQPNEWSIFSAATLVTWTPYLFRDDSSCRALTPLFGQGSIRGTPPIVYRNGPK